MNQNARTRRTPKSAAAAASCSAGRPFCALLRGAKNGSAWLVRKGAMPPVAHSKPIASTKFLRAAPLIQEKGEIIDAVLVGHALRKLQWRLAAPVGRVQHAAVSDCDEEFQTAPVALGRCVVDGLKVEHVGLPHVQPKAGIWGKRRGIELRVKWGRGERVAVDQCTTPLHSAGPTCALIEGRPSGRERQPRAHRSSRARCSACRSIQSPLHRCAVSCARARRHNPR